MYMLRQINYQILAILTCTCFCVNQVQAAPTNSSLAEKTSQDFTAVAKKAIPAVVSIKVKGTSNQSDDASDLFQGEDFFRQFFSPRRESQPTEGQASGFIISPEGHIFTNSHVVQKASEIKVTLNDGREFLAKVVGSDSNTDIALIKIDAGEPLPFIELGNSDALDIGQWAIAIGTPLGLRASLTVGVISAKGRNNLDLANVEDFIQTDAAINRGNSGGPLMNIEGKVIGMNTAIVSNMGTGGYMGIGFAIPSNMLQHVRDQIMKNGTVTRGFIGVALQNVDQDLAKAFGLTQTSGALVAEVSRGSPAEKAGLKQGDVIQAYNQIPVTSIGTLRNAIALMTPGTRLSLTVLRNGKTLQIPVEVGTFPDKSSPVALKNGSKLGVEVQELTPDIARNLGLTDETGVVISKVEPNSIAAWAGLKKGALISAVNHKKISTVDQFYQQLQDTPTGNPVLLLVKQGDTTRYLSLKRD